METISQWLAVAWFSLHVDDMPTPSHHVELALSTEDTVATATSRQLVLLVSCLETVQWPRMVDERMEDSHQHVEENCDALLQRSAGASAKPWSVHLFGEPIYWVSSPLSRGDSCYATDLVTSNRSDLKESCPKIGSVGSYPTQEKWPLHQKRSSAM